VWRSWADEWAEVAVPKPWVPVQSWMMGDATEGICCRSSFHHFFYMPDKTEGPKVEKRSPIVVDRSYFLGIFLKIYNI